MRGRVIILIVLVIVVAVALGLVFLLNSGGGSDSADTVVGTPLPQADLDATATAAFIQSEIGTIGTPLPPIDVVLIVIALQELPRGLRLTEDILFSDSPAVGLRPWPANSVPENSFTAIEPLEGLVVRSDIPRESPVLQTQLVTIENISTDLAAEGSDAALLLEPGKVAISMPLDFSGIGSVAYGLQPGDSVDVIMSFLFIEVDETFQTRQPNFVSLISRTEDGVLSFSLPLEGRPEPSTISSLGVLVSPSEIQRPRLVTQRTVENAKVIYVGYFPPDGNILGISSPTPFDTPTPVPVAPGTPAGTATTTSTRYFPVIVTIGVDPQDAIVLTWALDVQMPISFALRSAVEGGTTPTTAVTLQYMIDNYRIPQPPILPFALEPPIRSLRSAQLDILNLFGLSTIFTTGDDSAQVEEEQ